MYVCINSLYSCLARPLFIDNTIDNIFKLLYVAPTIYTSNVLSYIVHFPFIHTLQCFHFMCDASIFVFIGPHLLNMYTNCVQYCFKNIADKDRQQKKKKTLVVIDLCFFTKIILQTFIGQFVDDAKWILILQISRKRICPHTQCHKF